MDRAAVASVISVIFIIVLLITETAAQPIQYGDQWATLIYDNGVILAIGGACLSASIIAFLRGETMRTISRFVNAGTVLLVWFLAAGIGLGAYASNTNRYNGQRSESQLLMHAVPQPNMWGRHDDSWFALSDTVREYRGEVKLLPRDIDAELLPPVKTQLVIPPYFHHSPNIQSWITTKQENQKLVPTLHFIYRLTGREKVIRPGYEFEIHNFPGGEIDQIDLLTQEGAKVGRINLQAVRIITGAHDETTH